ncbi:MAG: hypothetical protein CM15mP120_28230 [Pseudomonadota bacterium]|nr:MAG: hypothetical protein CM15mP120_28230 [Pseudomonadota bacterium]
MANSPQAKNVLAKPKNAAPQRQPPTVRTYIKRVLGAVEAKDADTPAGHWGLGTADDRQNGH